MARMQETVAAISRRGFIRRAGLLGVALPLLAACSQAAPSGTAPAPTRGAALGQLPSYVPIQNTVSPPDLPGSTDGLVNPGWTTYPKQLFQAVKDPPGSGGDITVSLESNNPPPPPLDQNAHWQAFNKAVNAKVNVVYIPFADFD